MYKHATTSFGSSVQRVALLLALACQSRYADAQEPAARDIITFEDLAYRQADTAAVRLYGQYAARGITFHGPYVVDVRRRFHTMSPGSPTHAIVLCLDVGCKSVPFEMAFAPSQSQVSVRVGLTRPSSVPVNVVIAGLDDGANIVDKQSYTLAGNPTTQGTLVQLRPTKNRIARVVISNAQGANLILDDIAYSRIAVPDPGVAKARADSIAKADSVRRAQADSVRRAQADSSLRAHKDSIATANSIHKAKADSIAKALGDSIAKALGDSIVQDSTRDAQLKEDATRTAQSKIDERNWWMKAVALAMAILGVAWAVWRATTTPTDPPPLPPPAVGVFLGTKGLDHQLVEYHEARSLDLDLRLSVRHSPVRVEDDS